MRTSYVKFITVAALTLALAGSANAVVLWDQGTIDPSGPAIPNSHSSGIGGFNTRAVNDVTIPGGGWIVTKITQYYSGFDPNWPALSTGRLYVEPKTGPLPTVTPNTTIIPMSCVVDPVRTALLNQTVHAVSANVNLNLPPGDYWIGISPIRSLSPFGGNQQWATIKVGDPIARFNMPAGPWGNASGNWDGTIVIEGEAVVPVEGTSWSGIKALLQ
jgi:hypothetical protein